MPAQRARSWSVTGPRRRRSAPPRRQRLLAGSSSECGARRPVVEQHDGLLLALHRPEADQRLLGEPEEDVVSVPRPVSMPSLSNSSHHLGPAEAPVAGQLGGQQLGAALEVGLREPRLRAAARVGGLQARAAQREQPAHVLGRREVDRPAHQPRAHDLAILDRALDASAVPRASGPRSPTATGRSPAPAPRRASGRRRRAARSGRARRCAG